MQWDDYFSYNPETGDLMWKVYRSSNAKPGDIIRGTKSRNKHLRVNLNRKCYQVHCIVWEMHNGPIPEGYEIDHIDHDRWNNRLSNLRLVDDEGNARNMSLFKTNTSGVSGVGWHSQRKKWRATIWHKCKQISLGLFDNFDDAVRARRDAEIKYGYHPNHGH